MGTKTFRDKKKREKILSLSFFFSFKFSLGSGTQGWQSFVVLIVLIC